MPPKKGIEEGKTIKTYTSRVSTVTRADGSSETVTEVERTSMSVSRTVSTSSPGTSSASAIQAGVSQQPPPRPTAFSFYMQERLQSSGVKVFTPQRFTILFNLIKFLLQTCSQPNFTTIVRRAQMNIIR
jgi:hypothetical protein